MSSGCHLVACSSHFSNTNRRVRLQSVAVLLDRFLLQHAERLTREIFAAYGVFGGDAKRVAEFVAGETSRRA